MLKNKLKLFFFILTTTNFFVFSTNLFVENKNKILIKEETLSQEKFKVFRIYAKSWEDVKAVGELRKVSQESQEIDFWLDSSVQPGQFADVMVSPSGMLFFEKFLKEHSSLNTEITVNDVQNLIIKNELLPKLKWRRQKNLKKERRKEKNEENSKFHRSRRSDFLQNKFDQLRGVQYPFGEYTNYNEMVRYMRTLEFYYPHLVQLLQIGTTHEGRSIEGVKIGISSINNFNKENDQNKTIEKTKKAFWIDGNMHAREWASSHTALFIINQLISSYGKDPFLTKALEEIDFFIIPCANPDGFEFSRSSINPKIRLWRKNRSPEQCTKTWNGLLCCRGVDLNRNFDFHWAETGSSLNACSNLYSGKRAFSEPESRAISDFLKNNNEEDGEKRFYAFMTLHTYAQMWIHPFSHEYNTYPSDAEDLKNVALRATERLEKIYGTHYRVGTGADLLAPASGGSDDWAKETLGIKYVYLVELRPKLELSNGFILNQEELLDTAVETFEAIKEVIKAVMSESSFNVKNTTESNINLINDTLKLDDNEEERINSSTSVNELKQYMENNITFGSLLGEISKLETKESQLETTMTSVKQVEEKKEFEQYTQHTTETFDFIFRIEGEEAKEGGDEIKRLKENINNSNINFPSTSTQQVLFPLFNNSNSSAFENEQKTEDVDISKLTISLPFTVNGKIENIEETASSTSSSSTSTSSSKESETSLLTLNSIFEEDSTQSSSIAEDKISSETTSTSSTTTSSSTTLKSATISFGSRIESMSKSINTTTTSSSTSTSSSSTSRSTFSSLSSNMITLPTLLTSKKYPIEFVSFDEKKIELKPLIKKYLNFKSTTKSISFPIFDNDIEIDKENEGENDKITTEKIGKTELIEETKTEQKKELEQFKQYNQTTFSSLAETTTISTILESEKINKSTILPHLWMKTQKIFTLPWVQTRRLSLAKLLRIQKIPILSTKSTTTTPNNNLLLTKSTITKPPSTMLFTAVDEISEKGKQEFVISPPQLISPPLSPRLYLAPRFLGNAFSGSYEDDFCCLHKIGNDGQIKGISLKGVSAINLIKSVLLEEKTTKIPTSTSTTTLTTINDEIVQIMPKKCSDKKSSCAFWIRAHSPVCTEQHNFMERNCAFSCGFCY